MKKNKFKNGFKTHKNGVLKHMNINIKLSRIIKNNNSLVCVGLDSDFNKLPELIRNKINPQFEFNKIIIDATHDLVCAYKPNSAFYEARGEQGIKELKMTCDYLRKNYPDIIIILDAKRADIGSTNEGYVKFIFDYLQVDAVTLHPYLGEEALSPFLERKDKGCIILCKTSNKGSGEFQNGYYSLDSRLHGNDVAVPMYKYVAHQITTKWNKNNNCMLVVGATYPKELAEVRKIAGDMTFLVPGIGTQGGDIEQTAKAGLNSKKEGMIINFSRQIIFSTNPREETVKLLDEINQYRN